VSPEPFDPNRHLRTDLGLDGAVQKVTCLMCRQVIFALDSMPTYVERLRQGRNMAVHMESHGMKARYGRCKDPKCEKFHFAVYSRRENVPPSQFRGNGRRPR